VLWLCKAVPSLSSPEHQTEFYPELPMGAGFWATLPTRRAQFRVLQVVGVQISALVTRGYRGDHVTTSILIFSYNQPTTECYLSHPLCFVHQRAAQQHHGRDVNIRTTVTQRINIKPYDSRVLNRRVARKLILSKGNHAFAMELSTS
jgi:hypothetical protein